MTSEDLLARVEALEARAAIEDLMQRYASAADAKYTVGCQKAAAGEIEKQAGLQAACFAPDAEWNGGRFGGAIRGRDAIFRFFCASPWRFTAHHYSLAGLVLSGSTAQLRWRLLELGVRETGETMLLTGLAEQRCARFADRNWLITSMSFARLHAVTLGENALQCLVPEETSLELQSNS